MHHAAPHPGKLCRGMLRIVVNLPEPGEQTWLISLEIARYILRRIAQKQTHFMGKAFRASHAAAKVG